jgi:murein DD-endopeptidase MepM/ murein hydrolase activator NlpD
MRALRVPLWVVLTVVFMAVAGVAGYFVPFDQLILTEQELAQQNSLAEQNERLHNNIGATLRMLSGLRERTERLQTNKNKHRDLIGLPDAERDEAAHVRQRASVAPPMPPTVVLERLGESERLIGDFAELVSAGRQSLFDTIPVIRPVAMAESIMSRRFGMGRDPFTGKQKMHYGVDFAADIGVSVIATASGTVSLVENDPVWGRRVVISHGRGFRTVYAHLGTVKVTQGRTVRRGEEIGTVGMSGLTTGPHVHYELWHRDRQLNPEYYFFPEWIVALQD